MSDRIVILKDGRIQQQGEPKALYSKPKTPFVADFLGKSNFIDVEIVKSSKSKATCTAGGETLVLATEQEYEVGSKHRIAIRPERIRVAEAGKEAFAGTVQKTSYLGGVSQLILNHDGFGDLHVSFPTHSSSLSLIPKLGISFGWDSDACVFLED